MRALVVTWGPGGNLPPMLAAAGLLARRGHDVAVLASGETRDAAARLGFPAVAFHRSPDPDVSIAFEAQAEAMLATAAGAEIALDTRDAIEEVRPDLLVVDCMLPAALAAGEATATPTASLVHFLYGLARRVMRDAGGSWTTDLHALAGARRALGLGPVADGLTAWEAPDLVLVTAPRWLDVDADVPPHVVHAGPLGVSVPPAGERSRVLLTFSTTVMDGQPELIERLPAAAAGLGLRATLTLGPAVQRDAVRVPDDVEVLQFAEHDRLLPECAIVVCHGGLGTVLRALAHGVPQLVLPLGRDQAFNASRVEDLGAGIGLPLDAPPDRIRAALDTLLTDASFGEAARRAAERIAADRLEAAATDALERAAGLDPGLPAIICPR
jgi:UDP:flavonoid glycosyltransferase YjiC (YdhE family)